VQSIREKLKTWARSLEIQTRALAYACRDPRTPWYAKALGAVVVAYALSPIDLIPDFIPVLGYLDDLILIPLGVALTVRLIPRDIMERSRAAARGAVDGPKKSGRVAAVVIVAVWCAVLAAVTVAEVRRIARG
jgi:uncharacterized membrane protein YkvA (DUF1232 family)